MVLCFVDTTKAEEADQIDPMEELGYTFWRPAKEVKLPGRRMRSC